MLGNSMCMELASKGHDVHATDVAPSEGIENLDVRDFVQLRQTFAEIRPEMVMHLAAETDVDRCEVEPDSAYLTNAIGTLNVALMCQKYDIEMAYVSTIGVFRGDKPQPYTEFDVPDPLNVYGTSKLEGERTVERLLRRYYIIRPGWMMGGGPSKEKKFVGKIMKTLAQSNRLLAVDDKLGSPTYAPDFSRCVSNLIETGYYGIYHCTNRGYATRYDVAVKVVECLGRKDVEVKPVSSAFFPLPAARARSEMSLNYKLGLLKLDSMRNWEEALRDYIDKFWK